MRLFLKLLLLLMLLVLGSVAVLWQWRPGMGQHLAHQVPESASVDGVSITWLGVSAVLIQDGESAILIDPFFSRPGLASMASGSIAPDERAIQSGLNELGLERLDAVAVSHSHYDHAMDAGVVARMTGARLIGSESTLNIGRGAGLDEGDLILAGRSSVQFGGFELRFIESQHAGATGGFPTGEILHALAPPVSVLDYKLGGTFSILVSHSRGNVLHHGSAGYAHSALEGVRADAVVLGVALIEELPSYLEQVVDMVGAQVIYPVHWDDFTRPLSEPLSPMPVVVRLDRFYTQMAARPDLQLRSLRPGRPHRLF